MKSGAHSWKIPHRLTAESSPSCADDTRFGARKMRAETYWFCLAHILCKPAQHEDRASLMNLFTEFPIIDWPQIHPPDIRLDPLVIMHVRSVMRIGLRLSLRFHFFKVLSFMPYLEPAIYW